MQAESSNLQVDTSVIDTSNIAKDFLIGTGVHHPDYGFGLIAGVSEHEIKVEFDKDLIAFDRPGILKTIQIDESDVVKHLRIEQALIEGILVSERAAVLCCQIRDYLREAGEDEDGWSKGSWPLCFQQFKVVDDKKPALNKGVITYSANNELLQFEYEVLFQLDELQVDDYYEDRFWLQEQEEEMVRGLIEVAQLHNPLASYHVTFLEKYASDQEEDSLEKEGVYLGLRVKTQLNSLEVFVATKATMELFFEKCSHYIGAFGVQTAPATETETIILDAKRILQELLAEFSSEDDLETNDDENEDPSEEEDNTVPLTFRDFVVISNRHGCISKNHEMEKVIALLSFVFPGGKLVERRIPAFHCQDCNEYYLHDYDFEKAKQDGGLALCRMVYEHQYYKQDRSEFVNLNEESPLKLCGYNVNKAEGLTETQRRTILDRVIEDGVMAYMNVRSHIAWLVRKRRGYRNMEEAISKWEADLEYLRSEYHEDGTKIRVSSVTTKRYKPREIERWL